MLANDVEYFNTTCSGSEIVNINYCENSKDTFWVEMFLKKPLSNFLVSQLNFGDLKKLNYLKKTPYFDQFQYEIYRKIGEKYLRYGATPPIDWCKFNEGQNQMLNFQKIIINTLLKSAKMLFHPCPFQGKHTFFNITPPKQVYEIFQPGIRRFLILMIDSDNKTVFSLTTHLKISGQKKIYFKKFVVHY